MSRVSVSRINSTGISIMDFRTIVEESCPKCTSNIELRPCPDQYVGQVAAVETEQTLRVRHPASDRPAGQQCVLLVLESPHIDEFRDAPAPARGTTGRHIVRYLRQVPGLESTDTFGLVLINAVQYQCSLGQPPKSFRDVVFRAVWEGGGRSDFAARLKRLYRTGDTVVNCCTKGKSSNTTKQLRWLVHDAIALALPGAPVLNRNHPSFWQVPENRKRDWAHAT